MAASSSASRSLCFLILALLAPFAQAGSFIIYDRWSYVSGTAVTWGGPVQSDVWHDATTRPLVVKLTLASFYADSALPLVGLPHKKFIRLSPTAKFISVVGTTPQGGPVTTGFQVGAPQYYDYDFSAATRSIPASVEFLITFDSKTTDIAGTTFTLTYDCAALKNDIDLVDIGSCVSSKASGGTPGYLTVKIGWVPVISIHEVTGTDNSPIYEDVTGQWIDLAPETAIDNVDGYIPAHDAKKHVVRFAPQSGKQIFTGTQASAPSGFLQSWGNLALQHIFGKPTTLDIVNGENVQDAWKTFAGSPGTTTIDGQSFPTYDMTAANAILDYPGASDASDVAFARLSAGSTSSFVGSISSTALIATSVSGVISVGQVITWTVGGTSATGTISVQVSGSTGGAGTYTLAASAGTVPQTSMTGLHPNAAITPTSKNVFFAGTKVFQTASAAIKTTSVADAIDFDETVPIKKVSLTTSNYCEVQFKPVTPGAAAGDYDVVIAGMAFLRAGDFAPSAQTVFNVKSGFVVTPEFYETSAFDVKNAWFPSDKAISLRVSTPLGAVNTDLLSTEISTLYGNKYLVASYDTAPADTSTKYGIGPGKLLSGSSLPAGITGGNNEQIADKNYQTLGADSTRQVWYQYALATTGVAPGKYEFNIAQGSMFAASLKPGTGPGTGGCVNDASGICKCTDVSSPSTVADLYRKTRYTLSPYREKFDSDLYAGDNSCRGIIANARASADLKIGFVPTVKILEGTPPALTTDLDTRFDVTSKWLNLESKCAFTNPVGTTGCHVPQVPHALVITPPTGYLFDVSTGNQPTTTDLLPWVNIFDGMALTVAQGTYFSELRLSSDYAKRNSTISQQLASNWEIPFFAVDIDDYKPGAYSVIVESNKIKRQEEDSSVEVKNARTVIVVRAGFDTEIHFVDSAPAPYLQDTDRWFLNTNENVMLEIKAGRLPSTLATANKAQFVLAPNLADTFLPLANLQQSATSAAYTIPSYGIESGQALGGMSALPGDISSTTIGTLDSPLALTGETMKYALSLSDDSSSVEPGYYQFNISSGVFLRIVGRYYAASGGNSPGFYDGATLNGVSLDSSLKLGYMLQNEPRVCPGFCFVADCSNPTNDDINRANLILSQSKFCAPGVVSTGLAGAVYSTNTAVKTSLLTTGNNPKIQAFNVVNPYWWGGRVLKDQLQVFNYQKSQVLQVGFSLDYTIKDAATKRIVTTKAGATETLSWLNPNNDHEITFTAGVFDSYPQTFSVSTLATPPVEEKLIDAYQVPANIKNVASSSFTGSIATNTDTRVITLTPSASQSNLIGKTIRGVGVPNGMRVKSGSGTSWVLEKPNAASFSGYIVCTSVCTLSASSVSGVITVGQVVTWPGAPSGTHTIYDLDDSITGNFVLTSTGTLRSTGSVVNKVSMSAFAFGNDLSATFRGSISANAQLTVIANSLVGNLIQGQFIYGTGVDKGTRLGALISSNLYGLELVSSFTGDIATTSTEIKLTVSSLTGTIRPGQVISGAGVPTGTTIKAFLTSTTWSLNVPPTVIFSGKVSEINNTMIVYGITSGTLATGQIISWDGYNSTTILSITACSIVNSIGSCVIGVNSSGPISASAAGPRTMFAYSLSVTPATAMSGLGGSPTTLVATANFTSSMPITVASSTLTTSSAQYIQSTSVPFCTFADSALCTNSPYFFPHPSFFKDSAFLLPKGASVAPLSMDESRITYTLQAEAAALTGEYKILIPEGAFTREHTLAKNARQVITVKVGHGLKIDFKDVDLTLGTLNADIVAAITTSSFGSQSNWINAAKTADGTLKLLVAHSGFASVAANSISLDTTAVNGVISPTWSSLFPDEKPGVSASLSDGITAVNPVKGGSAPSSGALLYALSNINDLEPGSYRFDIPSGKFTQAAPAANIFRSGDQKSVGSSSPDQSITGLEIKNYAYTIYLKIGFPSYVDFIDSNKVSLMDRSGISLQALSFSSEYLSLKKKTASVRAVINTQTPQQSMALYNTVLNNAVTSDSAFGTITITSKNVSLGSSPSVDVSIRDPSDYTTSQFSASYLITGVTGDGLFPVNVKNGVYCTLKTSECTFDANGVIVPTCICNAPTHTGTAPETSYVNFAAADVAISIYSTDTTPTAIYSSPLIAGSLPSFAPQGGAGLQYNVFDPDFQYVQVMPIFTNTLTIALTFSPNAFTTTTAAWTSLIEAPSGFPSPSTPTTAGEFKWAANTLIPGTWDLVVKPIAAVGNPRARIRLVIGPNPVFYKLDEQTQLIPRAPGGPFATNVNSLYLSIGGTKYRKVGTFGADDAGCELKLSDILLVLDSNNNDVTKAISVDDTPVTINTKNKIPGADRSASFLGAITSDIFKMTLSTSSVTGEVAIGQSIAGTTPSGLRIKSGSGSSWVLERPVLTSFTGALSACTGAAPTRTCVLTPTSVSGPIVLGQEIMWPGAAVGVNTVSAFGSTAGTFVVSSTGALETFRFVSLTSSFTGALITCTSVTSCTFTASAPSATAPAVNNVVTWTGAPAGVHTITAISGSTYTITSTGILSKYAMTGRPLTASFKGALDPCASATSCTLTPSSVKGALSIGQVITWSGAPPGVHTITAQPSATTFTLTSTGTLAVIASSANQDMSAMGFFGGGYVASSFKATLSAAVTNTPAKLTVTASTTTGTIAAGQYVYGTGVLPGTRIVSGQTSSPYNLELASSFSGTISNDLTTGVVLLVVTDSTLQGTIKQYQVISGLAANTIPAGLMVLSSTPNSTSAGPPATTTYTLAHSKFQGTIATATTGTGVVTLTVTSTSTQIVGAIAQDQILSGTGIPVGTFIATGTGSTWTLTPPKTIFTGSLNNSNIMTVTGISTGSLVTNQRIYWTTTPTQANDLTITDCSSNVNSGSCSNSVTCWCKLSGIGLATGTSPSSFSAFVPINLGTAFDITGVLATSRFSAATITYNSASSSFLLTSTSTPTGTVIPDQVISGTNVPVGTKILAAGTASNSWTLTLPSAASFTASISGTTLTVSSLTAPNVLLSGQVITWAAQTVNGIYVAASPSAAITISSCGAFASNAGSCIIAIASGSMPSIPFGTIMSAAFPTTSFTVSSTSMIGQTLSVPLTAMTGVGGDISVAVTTSGGAPMTGSAPITLDSTILSSSFDASYDAIQSGAPTYRIGLDGLTDGEYSFVIGGGLSLTPTTDALTAYNARALTAMAQCFDASFLYSNSISTIKSGDPYSFVPVEATASTTDNIYASSSFDNGLIFKFTVDRVKPTPMSLTYNDASPTCLDPSDSTTCTDLGPIYTTSPSGEILLPPSLFSDEGTPNEYLRVSVNSEDDRGIKLVRQYHDGPPNSAWPSGSLATDPLTLTTTVLTTSSANVRDPAGNAVFMVNATDEAGNWAEASFTIPIIKRSSGVLTAIDKRNVQSKSTLYTGSPSSLTSGSLKLVIVADFDVSVSGLTKDNLQCIAGNTPCFSGVSPVTMTASPGGKRFTFNFDIASTFITQGKLITISILMSRTVGSTTMTVLSTRDKYEIAAPSPVYVSIDKTAVIPVTYVAPYRAVVNTKYTLVLPSKLFYDDVSTPKKIKLLTATPSSQFGLTFSSDLQGNATITGIPLAQPTTAYDNRVTFTIRGQDEAGNVDKEVNVFIGIHAAEEIKPSLTVLGSLLQFNEKDDDATISSGDAIPSSKLINFDSAATFTAGTGQKFAAVYAYLTRPEPNEERDVGVSCSTTRSSASTWFSTALFSTPITEKNSLSLVSRLGYSVSGYPYTNDYCRWERLRTSSTFTAPSGTTVSSYSVDPLTGEGRIGLESCKKSPTFIGTLACPNTCTLTVISGTVPTSGQVITWSGAPSGVHTVGAALAVTSTGTLVAFTLATTMTIVDIPCAPGFSSTSDSTNCRGTAKYRDSEVEPEVCTPGLDAATIQSWIRSLQYVNERTDVTNGNRIIRVDVWSPGHIAVGKRIDALGNLVTSLVGGDRPGFGVAASASRTLKVAAVNNAPRVTVHPTAIWIEKGDPVPVLDQSFVWTNPINLATSQVKITDMDDNDVTAAYVQIATSTDPSTAAEGPAYAGCDKTRDRLFLGSDYLDSGSKASSSPATARGTLPKVIASWSSASCTLTLIPAAPLTRVTKEDMTIALLSIKYTNDDYYNPVNFDDGTTKNNHGRVRMISVKVDDAANQGKLADRKSNDLLAAKPTNQVYLFLQCYDDVPVVNVRRIFGVGGILSSTNSYANILTTYDMDGVVKIKAFPLLTPPIYDQDGNTVEIKSQTVTPYQLEFDLTQVKDANGNVVPGLFAKGQIYDLDSTAPPTSPETDGPIDIKFFFDTDSPNAFTTGIASAKTNDVKSLFDMSQSLFGNSNNGPNPSGTKCNTCVFYVNPGSQKPEWTDPVTKAYYKTGFVYSSTGPSVLTIILNNNVPLSRLGAYTLQLQFGYVNKNDNSITTMLDPKLTRPSFWPALPSSTAVDPWSTAKFYVDVRQQACIDPSASRASAEKSSTETNILKRINADTSANGLLKELTGLTTALTEETKAIHFPKFFAENSLCSYEPVSVIAASGLSYAVSRNNYNEVKNSLENSLAALKATGASVESQALALKDLRNQARGAFFVNIPAGSLASRGSMDFSATKVGASSISLLPALKTSAIESFDTDVAVRLQPAGTTFSEPVQVCIFAGDTPAKHFKYLSMASQKDPGDPSKGYLYWETLSGQSFNPATGEVCGKTDHFTVFAPVTRPTQESATIDKAHLMGGSCPNQCSGQGTCRQQGQCICFAGFEGYDCSMRTCPSAESWGQDQEVMHTQSECAGRGLCQRTTGTCSCFDGFEGAACERATCPNDCNGHGKCRTLAELPKVQQYGYSSWEVKRIQKCLCDGGFSGADCSQRYCPFGDDPETICRYQDRQVQRFTLDFYTDPTGTGRPDVDAATDQFALIFTSVSGTNYTTPMIDNIWEGTPESSTAVKNALLTLPEFAVMGVEVSAVPTDSGSLSVSYDLTFTGLTNTGNEFLLSCPYNSLGSTGCPAPGCRPKFNQLRILKAPYLPPSVQLSPLSVLQQPKPLGSSALDNDELTPNIFGVEITLMINKYFMPGTTTLVYTYSFVNTKVYGQAADASGNNKAYITPETPFPPMKLRSSIPGPYGILFEFGSDTQLGIDFSGSGPFTFSFGWRLPSCSVSVVQYAAKEQEKAECSNRGICNRQSGECECFDGYAGYSCAQQTVYI